MSGVAEVVWDIIRAIGAGGGFLAVVSAGVAFITWRLHPNRNPTRYAVHFLLLGLVMVGLALGTAWLLGDQ